MEDRNSCLIAIILKILAIPTVVCLTEYYLGYNVFQLGVYSYQNWILLALGLVLFIASLVLLLSRTKNNITCRIGSLQWDRNAFCRGWLITGATGVGKTVSGINLLMDQLFQNERGMKDKNGLYSEHPWGGICIDEKGTYTSSVVEMAQKYERSEDLYILETRPEKAKAQWRPAVRFNLLAEENITASTYASTIIKTAEAVSGCFEEKGFFRTQAQTHILKAIELLRAIREAQFKSGIASEKCVNPSLKAVHNLLSNKEDFNQLLVDAKVKVKSYGRQEINVFEDRIMEEPMDKRFNNSFELKSEQINECIQHFEKNYWVQPLEQLGGIQGTINNYLTYFLSDEIAEVFCKDSTFSFNDLEKGKIICVAMPHKLAIERRYICTFLKILFYSHVLGRFSKLSNKQALEKINLLVCWQDEAQRFIIEEDGDVDIIREAQATTVMACQSKTSLIPPLNNKEKANVTILNLRNRLIFRASDLECAESSADFLGKVKKMKRSISKGGGKTTFSYSDEMQHTIEVHELMKLPEFTAIVCHANSCFKKYILRPLMPNGKVPHWWLKALRSISLKVYIKQKLMPSRGIL